MGVVMRQTIRQIMQPRNKAQSIVEYAVLIAVVAIAFSAMYIYGQRAVNANFQMVENRVNAG